jgi:SAM-dependent methyltransferase
MRRAGGRVIAALVAGRPGSDNRAVGKGYEPAEYWTARLDGDFSLRGTGHLCYSEGYNRWLYRAKRRALRRALRGLRPPLDALDIGSGTGWVVNEMATWGASVEGCDIVESAVQRLRVAYPAVPFFVARWGTAELPRHAAGVDVVTLLDVAYHVVDDDDWRAGVADTARLLRPGGRLIVTDGFGSAAATPAPHVRFRSQAAWAEAGAAAGLDLTSVFPYVSWLSRERRKVGGDGSLARMSDSVRGAVEYGLEVVAPRAAHLRCAVFVRRR